MAQARRRSSRSRFRKPGWLLLVVGIGIGVAGVMLWQMYSHRGDGRGGLANLFFSFSKPAQKVAVKKEPEPAKIRKPKAAKAKPEEGVSYILQAGSFAGFEEADQMKAKLALSGLVAQIQKITIEGKGEYHRVRLGPYEKIEQLDATAVQLQKLGIKAIRLKVKKGEAG